MNALPQISTAASATSRLVSDLSYHLDNFETGRAASAVAAAEAGRPAFWTNQKYSHAVACEFVLAANQCGIAAALKKWVDLRHPRKTAEHLLSTLIPLNVKGDDALQEARETEYWNGALGAPGRVA